MFKCYIYCILFLGTPAQVHGRRLRPARRERAAAQRRLRRRLAEGAQGPGVRARGAEFCLLVRIPNMLFYSEK